MLLGEERREANRGGEELQPGLNCDHCPPLSDGELILLLFYCSVQYMQQVPCMGPSWKCRSW